MKRIAIELNDSGKILRAIADSTSIRHRPAGNHAAPETELQELLASLWAETLKVQAVGINDNFFDLGGQSLMAMQLGFKIEETFNVHFPLESFLGAPVLAAQAERIQDLLLQGAGDSNYLEQMIDDLEQNPEEPGPSGPSKDTIASGAREVL